MSKAESTVEVKQVFVQTVEELLKDVLDEKIKFEEEDLSLLPHADPCFKVSDRLRSDRLLKTYWTESDLPHVIHRLAESATGRYKHLEKHPEKTEVKIRM
ncbi:MAG: hypothetical protein PHS17_17465 [Desulfobacterales bacterium]|nr:hypothetical protein [Desulfobacterales bacterium]